MKLPIKDSTSLRRMRNAYLGRSDVCPRVIKEVLFRVAERTGIVHRRHTVDERLSMRDFMDGLRATGVEAGGPVIFSQQDKQTFANQLDRFLSTHVRRG